MMRNTWHPGGNWVVNYSIPDRSPISDAISLSIRKWNSDDAIKSYSVTPFTSLHVPLPSLAIPPWSSTLQRTDGPIFWEESWKTSTRTLRCPLNSFWVIAIDTCFDAASELTIDVIDFPEHILNRFMRVARKRCFCCRVKHSPIDDCDQRFACIIS